MDALVHAADSAIETPVSPTPSAGDSPTVVRSFLIQAKTEFLDKYNGAAIQKQVPFGNPSIQNMWRRTFDLTSRNIFQVAMMGPILLDKVAIDEPVKHITGAFKNALAEVEKQQRICKVRLDDAQIKEEDYSTYNAPRTADIRIVHPLSMQHVKLLQAADELLRLYSTLWLHGEMEQGDYEKAVVELKRRLRSVAFSTRSMYLSMRKRLAAKNAGVVKSSADDSAGEDVDGSGKVADGGADAQAASAEASAGADMPPAAEAGDPPARKTRKKAKAGESPETPASEEAEAVTA